MSCDRMADASRPSAVPESETSSRSPRSLHAQALGVEVAREHLVGEAASAAEGVLLEVDDLPSIYRVVVNELADVWIEETLLERLALSAPRERHGQRVYERCERCAGVVAFECLELLGRQELVRL